MKKILAFIFAITLGVMIILSLSNNELFTDFGDTNHYDGISSGYITSEVGGDEEPALVPVNIVTGILVDYRGFDTLGEVTVLFVSSIGVALLLGVASPKRINLNFKPNFMLSVGSRALFGVMFLTGIYIVLHAKTSPGGSFPGGAMIASSILILYLSNDTFRTDVSKFKLGKSLAASGFVLVGLIGLLFTGEFLANFHPFIMDTILVLIAIDVAGGIVGIIDNFLTEERV
ncbi:MAG: cation:proton antiporter [Candidatus Izimaplasma sp.]|nr:cation:proton antiporter [Candidatus Izimaplasma bacterium]